MPLLGAFLLGSLPFLALGSIQRYVLTDLGEVDGNVRINAVGTIVGGFVGGAARVNTDGTRVPIPIFPTGINAAGVVAGLANFPNSVERAHPSVYRDGVLTDLGTLRDFGVNAAINADGVIVGTCQDNPDEYSPYKVSFLFQNGVMTELPVHGNSTANAINDRGQIVGENYNLDGKDFYRARAYIYDHGKITYLERFPGYPNLPGAPLREASANAINSRGEVAGTIIPGGTRPHAFFYSRGTITMLKAPKPYPGTDALALNDRAQIVGTLSRRDGPAFLYEAGKLTVLSHVVVQNPGWDLIAATDINNAGLIVGTGRTPGGETHAFLLTPQLTITVERFAGFGKITTTASRLTIHGKVTGKFPVVVNSLSYRNGRGPYRPIKPVPAWKFTTRLHRGRNVIRILATNAGGETTTSGVNVIRK